MTGEPHRETHSSRLKHRYCGADPDSVRIEIADPVEQIVVREPGQPADKAAADGASSITAVNLVARGEEAFAACAACHSVTAGQASGVGPNLHGVVMRTAGTLEGYDYSDAMAASGVVWDAASLDAFLTNPSATIPGTRMVAGAVSDQGKREALIAYLTSISE